MPFFDYWTPLLSEWLLDALTTKSPSLEQRGQFRQYVARPLEGFEPGQVEALATLLVSWNLPDAWDRVTRQTQNRQSGSTITTFVRDRNLPASASRILLAGYLNFIEKAGPMVDPGELSDYLMNDNFLDGKTYRDMVLWQLANPNFGVADLGTAYRHLCYMDAGRIGHVEAFWAFSKRPETPVEALAQMMLSHQGDVTFWEKHLDWGLFQSRVDDKYPELIGLPRQFLLETLATQPVSEEWEKDMWDVPVLVGSR